MEQTERVQSTSVMDVPTRGTQMRLGSGVCGPPCAWGLLAEKGERSPSKKHSLGRRGAPCCLAPGGASADPGQLRLPGLWSPVQARDSALQGGIPSLETFPVPFL